MNELIVNVPIDECLLVASALFCIGLFGVMVRRNIIFIFMSLEIMLSAAALAFVAAGAHWQQPDGQIMFLLILTLAAAEIAVALALLLHSYKQHHTVDVDRLSDMRG